MCIAATFIAGIADTNFDEFTSEYGVYHDAIISARMKGIATKLGLPWYLAYNHPAWRRAYVDYRESEEGVVKIGDDHTLTPDDYHRGCVVVIVKRLIEKSVGRM
jgi:hypothetical protein